MAAFLRSLWVIQDLLKVPRHVVYGKAHRFGISDSATMVVEWGQATELIGVGRELRVRAGSDGHLGGWAGLPRERGGTDSSLGDDAAWARNGWRSGTAKCWTDLIRKPIRERAGAWSRHRSRVGRRSDRPSISPACC